MKPPRRKVPPRNKLTVIPSSQKDIDRIEALRDLTKDGVELGIAAPTTVTFEDHSIDVLYHTKLPNYQRDYQHSRMLIINASMRLYGIQPTMLKIILNKDRQIIEGRHTVVALYINRVETVPCCVMDFPNAAQEIEFFNHINTPKKAMKREQTLFNEYQAKDPLAVLMYKLGHIDPVSKWGGNVAFLNVPKPMEKMTITNFGKILHWVGLGIARRREGEYRMRLGKAALKAGNGTEYQNVRQRVNNFHDWYYTFATKQKIANDPFHKDLILTTMLEFFRQAHLQDSSNAYLAPERILNSSIALFSNRREWDFERLLNFSHKEAVNQMVDRFNKGRSKKNRMVIPERP